MITPNCELMHFTILTNLQSFSVKRNTGFLYFFGHSPEYSRVFLRRNVNHVTSDWC